MRCVLVQANVTFSERIPLLDPARNLYLLTRGGSPPKSPGRGSWAQPGGTIATDLAEDRVRVVVSQNRWIVGKEFAVAPDDFVRPLVEQFRLADPQIGELTPTRIEIRTHWILEFRGSWPELLTQYRTAFVASGTPFDHAVDLSVMGDFRDGAYAVSVQHGPMLRAQLESGYVHFVPTADEVPEQFLFASFRHVNENPVREIVTRLETELRALLDLDSRDTASIEARFTEGSAG